MIKASIEFAASGQWLIDSLELCNPRQVYHLALDWYGSIVSPSVASIGRNNETNHLFKFFQRLVVVCSAAQRRKIFSHLRNRVVTLSSHHAGTYTVQMVSLIFSVRLLARETLVLTRSEQLLRYGEREIQDVIIEQLGGLLGNPEKVKQDPLFYVSWILMDSTAEVI